MYAKKINIYSADVSKHYSNHEKQVILLIIANGKKLWRYLGLKKLSALLRETTSKNNGDFYYLSCPHSLKTKNKLESYKRTCENKDFCNVLMRFEDTKLRIYININQYKKSDKAPFIIYANFEYKIEKFDDVYIILKIHLRQK